MIVDRKTWGSEVDFDATFGHLPTLNHGKIVADPMDNLTERECQEYRAGLEDINRKLLIGQRALLGSSKSYLVNLLGTSTL
jgi:hypothetical protein